MHKIKLAKSNIFKLKLSSVCIILYNTPHYPNTQYYTCQLYKLKYITQSNSFKLLKYIMQRALMNIFIFLYLTYCMKLLTNNVKIILGELFLNLNL